jgi:hypothetical protein
VTRRSWAVVAILAVALACGDSKRAGKKVRLRRGEVHVQVDSTGGIEYNGEEMSLDSLKKVLAQRKAAGNSVYYTRRPATGAPTPEQWVVFVTVSDIGLPIRFEGDSQPIQPAKTP